MADLKTNYVDDVLDASVNTKRKYNMIQNADGTVSFDDVTTYTQNGDSFGAKDVNDTNTAVNELNNNLTDTNENITNINNSLNNLQSEDYFPLPAYNSKQEWGYIYSYGKIATLVLHSYTDKVFADNTETAIAENVPIKYMPQYNDFVVVNGNWENNGVNIIKVVFKDNGNNTCNIILIPLKGNIEANAYIYTRDTYICKK